MTETPVISEVLDAGLIVHVRVVSEQFGSWQPEDNGMQRRSGWLAVEVVEILKGQLAVAAGDTVELDAVERGSTSSRMSDYYGIWAHVSTTPGTELVAFCDGASDDLREALTDDHCDALVPAEIVLPDLRLAMSLEARDLTPDALLAEAARHRTEGGALFARYIWAKTRNAVVGSMDRFNALMQIAEDPRTRTEAQEAYLLAAYEDATFTEELAKAQRARLARSMFRTALEDDSAELRAPLLDTFIPNLVEAEAPERLSASEVFGDESDLGERVRADAADPQTSTYSESLEAWLSNDASDA
jgi:hypothetical protein